MRGRERKRAEKANIREKKWIRILCYEVVVVIAVNMHAIVTPTSRHGVKNQQEKRNPGGESVS